MLIKKKIFISSLITLVTTILVLIFWWDIEIYSDHIYHQANLQMDFSRWMLYQAYIKVGTLALLVISLITCFVTGAQLSTESNKVNTE